tara:strand:- start:59 stop:502 length:444 start_codon:yes stop_codon:yes gene_type:complete
MSQDISFIQEELKGFIEVDSPFDLKIGNIVKYITIKDDKEYFYTGGKYLRMGDNKIYLDTRPSSCILKNKDKEGNVIYSTRLFIKDDSICLSIKDKNEYEKIIKTQQRIIETMTEKIKKNSDTITKVYEKNIKYEEVIKRLMEQLNK